MEGASTGASGLAVHPEECHLEALANGDSQAPVIRAAKWKMECNTPLQGSMPSRHLLSCSGSTPRSLARLRQLRLLTSLRRSRHLGEIPPGKRRSHGAAFYPLGGWKSAYVETGLVGFLIFYSPF